MATPANSFRIIDELAQAVDELVSILGDCRDDDTDIALCIQEVHRSIRIINKLIKAHESQKEDSDDDDW